jgi:diguanylate cyclase (GGDEF)-like protein
MMPAKQSPPALDSPEAQSPEARDKLAIARDEAAEQRDDSAVERLLQADLRDVAAAERDALAQEVLAGSCTIEQVLALYRSSRSEASAERRFASADRHADAEDRLAAGRDRHHAAADRLASAIDRDHASRDLLTGAYTRAAGFAELTRDVDRARRAKESFTLAFVDVDGLKAINDAGGHAAGDRALVHVVQALRAHLRAHDLIVRFGGDEFVCAVAAMADAELNNRLGLVSRALVRTPEHVHITVGLAGLIPGDTVDDLVGRADAAFYASRRRR